MGGDDDLDLYGRGAGPSRAGVARGLVRVLGVLVGAAIAFCGFALYVLRCFDTCPTDPSVDATIHLMSAALIVFGLVVAIASASVGTGWAAGAAAVAGGLGAVVAACGAVTLALVPSIDRPHGDPGDTAVAAVAMLVVGAAVTAAALFRRRRASRPRD